ncbi:hypothetical protein HMI54_001820 [Coelomomyces lativittatus]|nr:hypothetical protein HMI55_000583 [Coelomomyces lativittatus]KAJ1510172.1 hypothetical protein HMI54_001820 [Coelomomyces lativittatus]KAJ1512620.1 hypothetical protein HMI56_003809 [Coelomomyces lativittatus]
MASISSDIIETWFESITQGDEQGINSLLTDYPDLVYVQSSQGFSFPVDLVSAATQLLGSNTNGMNGLHFALINAEECDSASDDENSSDPLLSTLSTRRKQIIKKLIEMSSVDHLCNYRWGDENTLLHLVSFLGDIEVIGSLIRKGCTCQYVNALGLAPIDVAADEPTRHTFRSYIQSKQLKSPHRSSLPLERGPTSPVLSSEKKCPKKTSDMIPPLRTSHLPTTPTRCKIVGVDVTPLDEVLKPTLPIKKHGATFRISSVDNTPTNFAKIRSTFASLTQVNPEPPRNPSNIFSFHQMPSTKNPKSTILDSAVGLETWRVKSEVEKDDALPSSTEKSSLSCESLTAAGKSQSPAEKEEAPPSSKVQPDTPDQLVKNTTLEEQKIPVSTTTLTIPGDPEQIESLKETLETPTSPDLKAVQNTEEETSESTTDLDSQPENIVEEEVLLPGSSHDDTPLPALPSLSIDFALDDFQINLDDVLHLSSFTTTPPTSPPPLLTSSLKVNESSSSPIKQSLAFSFPDSSSGSMSPVHSVSNVPDVVNSRASSPLVSMKVYEEKNVELETTSASSSPNFGGIPIPKFHSRKATSQSCVEVEDLRTSLSMETESPKKRPSKPHVSPMKPPSISHDLSCIPGCVFIRIEKITGLDLILSERPMSHIVVCLRNDLSHQFFYTKPVLVMSNCVMIKEEMNFAVQKLDPISVEVRLRYESRPLPPPKSTFFASKFLRKSKENVITAKEIRDETLGKDLLHWVKQPSMMKSSATIHTSLGSIQFLYSYFFIPHFSSSIPSISMDQAYQTYSLLRNKISKVDMEGLLAIVPHPSRFYRLLGWKLVPYTESKRLPHKLDLTEASSIQMISNTSFKILTHHDSIECTTCSKEETLKWVHALQLSLEKWPGIDWKPVLDGLFAA